MSGPGDVLPEVLDRLRPICLGLPETYEEPAWVGVRWRIRTRTFAHVRTLDPGQVGPYGWVVGDEPICTLQFRSAECQALVAGGHPFFAPGWGTDVVSMVLGEVDWAEVGELMVESYRILAPKRLAALV